MKILDGFTNTLNQYPFLWIVYPILLFLPVALFVSFCVRIDKKPNTRTSQKNQNGPRQSQASVVSIKTAKKSSIHKLEVESTDDSDQERNKNKAGGKVRYIKRRGQSNGAPTVTEEVLNGDEGLEEEDPNQRWPFPPTLDQFNLMDSDIDPSLIEQVLEDSRLVQIIVRLSPGQGLGLAIVGGRGSPTGDVPIYVKRILPESVLQEDAKIKTGDELVAVNDLILYNSTKEYATQALSNVEGTVRLLLIQDL